VLSAQTIATSETVSRELSHETGVSNLVPSKPVITIAGFCDTSPDKNDNASNCKTVITEAQFEKVVNAVQPSMPTRGRREFALRYADALVMAKKAEEMGLDRGGNYEEQIRVARIQILSQNLKRVIQERASQISDKDVEVFYRNNAARFVKAEVDRVYIPKNQQPSSTLGKKLSDVDEQKRAREAEQTMRQEADNLRARAVTGEDFSILQADAYQVAGTKNAASNTRMEIRRASLPPSQALVMDLNPGQVSSVLPDPNGYVIYKMEIKSEIPLDQAREEIKAAVRSQRMQDEMREIQDSVTPTLDESYFAPTRHTQGIEEPAKSTSAQANKPN
jgi:hypothetical protein